MHAILTFQITESIVAFNINSDSLDTRFITILYVGDRNLIIVRFSITQIHTHQHRSPVLAFGTTCPGIYLEHATHLIRLVTKHVPEFQILHQLQSLGISRINLFFSDNLFLYIFIRQLQFLCRSIHLVIKLDPLFQLSYFLHLSLRPFGILPESGILRTQFFFF